jgi:hypothetical protein
VAGGTKAENQSYIPDLKDNFIGKSTVKTINLKEC